MAEAQRQTRVADSREGLAATIAGDITPQDGSSLIERSRRGVARLFTRRDIDIDVRDTELPTKGLPLIPITFVLFVLIPSLVVGFYFAFLASNQYVAEMRLVVRMAQRSQGINLSSVLSGISGGAGGGQSSGVAGLSGLGGGASSGTSDGTSVENAHIVTSYIQSRALLDDLMKTVDLREVYRRPEADFYARLPANATIEDIVEYWRGMVRTSIDSMSGIVTVEVRAFRPADSVLIAKTIESLSEKLVNSLSVRAREDTLKRAMDEVHRAQGLLYASLEDMERYRNREGLIDPVEAAKQTNKLLGTVLADLLETENRLFIAQKSLSPDSATVRSLQTRAENLRRQVNDLRQQLAGNEAQSKNVAGSIARFEEVAVKQKLAQTLYTMAETGLDRARQAAEAQTIYLTTFVAPSLPEDALFPKRLTLSYSTLVILLVLWGIGVMVVAAIEDHRLN